MYLKSIEVQGFKSFANKIRFEFHNGITGIVGPNGSGKSNVADAVRWVLGEQRIKQLRGGSMQDVIFSGTEMRKPQGFACVAITLDNSDHQLAIEYDEVTVSRRLYRSGESEYMINGSACRLKDINELFYDTGIGKEGYSIIGQGQIDKILSGKPEERRELFNEAAGIVKFKRRKAIAQKKLESEKQNLIRVGDILAELEKQVGPLARQSEAARKYLSLKEELKTHDVNQFLLESQSLREQLKVLTDKEAVAAGDLSDTNTKSDEIRESYDELEQVLMKLDEAVTENRSCQNQLQMQKSNLEGQINVLNEQINTEQMNADHINARIAAIRSDITAKQGQITQYKKDNTGIAAAAAAANSRQEEAQNCLRRDDETVMLLDHKLEEGKNSIITGLNEKAALTAREQRCETMLEQAQIRRSEVCRRLLKIKSDESVQEEQLAAELVKLAAVKERLHDLELSQTRLKTEIKKLEQEISRLGRNLQDARQKYQTSSTKLESLRNLAERYDGYGNSIRRVMEVKDRVRGIRGVVADLITTEKKYETAIETALGGSIQNVVTDSEQTAKQLIEYLKKNRYGRVTFLPLTSIGQPNGFSRKEVLKEPGIIGLASELVQVPDEFLVLAEYLLGRVVVAETIDDALAAARKYRYSLRIVTLDGELLSAGGSMTGGAFKNSSNLLGRKREIEELEEICQKTIDTAEKIQTDLERNESLYTEKKGELEQIKEEQHQESLRQNTVAMNVSQLEEKKADILDSAHDLVFENSQLEEQIREIEKSRAEIGHDILQLNSRNEQVNQAITELGCQMEAAKEKREETAGSLETIRLEAANLKQKVDFVMENIKRVEDETDRLQTELNELSATTGNSGTAITVKQQEIGQLKEQISDAARQKELLEQKEQELTGEKEQRSAEQKSIFRKRDELSDRISLLDKELFRLQSQKEKLEEKLEEQVNYMWNEYELTYSSAIPLKIPELDNLLAIRKQIAVLKDEIRALGNVNVNAIEDYKEISERYEFMKIQYDDLIQAEETLLKIIAELDAGMRRQFEEKFQAIRQEFDKVFKELFGGGHGRLELMEDEDILEAGIQIVSQPPGKKLQNMMQLSGGEKALTAIALLFAIQNLKPSPFCLLDEIEAALDDSNVDRFAGYLHKLTKNTQFIVITHRRGTMVASDRLYGITMQEKGVSTLVSVNLIEDQLDK